jgi:hypothetical protein
MDNNIQMILVFVAALLGSGSMTALVTYWINKCKKSDAISEGLRLLLQHMIEEESLKAIECGEIEYKKLRFLRLAHKCYHDGLKGNGDLDDVMSDLEEVAVTYKANKQGESKT